MRATIVHNPTAGSSRASAAELIGHLQEAGYAPSYHSTKEEGYRRALQDPGALVVVAGGDGTVAKVAAALAEPGPPLLILPLGTANNVARSLGISGSSAALIAALASARPRAVDLGVARTGWGERLFVEGAGVGLFPRIIEGIRRDRADSAARGKPAGKGLGRDLAYWLTRLPDVEAADYRISLDGRVLTGSYILVEVMNIRELGPNLCLAPQADPGDGLLDVVVAESRHRQHLANLLVAKQQGVEVPAELPVYRTREVRLSGAHLRPRVDGRVWAPAEPTPRPRDGSHLSISVLPRRLRVLA